jgi:hypothetical protein
MSVTSCDCEINLGLQNSLLDVASVAFVVLTSWNKVKWAKQFVANLYLYFCDFKYQIEFRKLCRFTLT